MRKVLLQFYDKMSYTVKILREGKTKAKMHLDKFVELLLC